MKIVSNTDVKPIIDDLIAIAFGAASPIAGFRISPRLYTDILQVAGE
ncbi:DUF3368 domain-containing protein [Moorena sp. SIO3H5]|nr:DUF3368 domain-containing protein [Moorena sp. SIO3H5]NEO73552.1 DUF3368 domain-containing protein [Moorena sp. SIO3H5]